MLCPKCSLPETALCVSLRKGIIYHKCSACGAKDPVDMSHKLCTFILKQVRRYGDQGWALRLRPRAFSFTSAAFPPTYSCM